MEILDLIDETDNVLGSDSYDNIHANKLLHRVVHALIVNKAGEYLLQLRSAKKSSHPLFWSFAAGGHVRTGETYLQALSREAQEEIGITITNPQLVGEAFFTDENGHKVKYQQFTIYAEGPFTIDPEEVDSVKWFSKEDLQKLIKDNKKVHPEMLDTIKKFYNI